MPDFWAEPLTSRLARATAVTSAQERGRLFEDLICQMLGSLPGIAHIERNFFTYGRCQEIDILYLQRQKH